jgi:hypothetical protein
MSKKAVGVVLVVAFNIAMGLTPQVPTAVTATGWVVTVFLAVLWWVLRGTEQPNPAESLKLSETPKPASSTLAMLNERGIRIDPDVLSRPPNNDD